MLATDGLTLSVPTGSWRAFRPEYVQRTSPCRAACPAGEDVAGWMERLREGELEEAWRLVLDDNPFPATMGRICLHPCEAACNRGRLDVPLAIRTLEGFLGERALESGWGVPPSPAGPRGAADDGSVGVVGAGPAGLACAYHLRRLGRAVTVYEARAHPGGLLTAALPPRQLPPGVVEAEVRRILDLGVELVTGVRVGRDVAWEELFRRHRAVFVATGAAQSGGAPFPGAHLDGVVRGLDLLEGHRAGRPVPEVRSACVVGAGLTGVEAARLLRSRGASVVVVAAGEPDPLLVERHAAAEAEGVRLWHGRRAVAVVGSARAEGVRLADGQVVSAELVVLAAGRAPAVDDLPPGLGVDGGGVTVDPLTGATGVPGLFAGGDLAGTRLAAAAVGSGKRAAAAIDAYLAGVDPRGRLEAARLGAGIGVAMRPLLGGSPRPPQARAELGHVVDFAEIRTEYFPRRDRFGGRGPAEGLAPAEADARGEAERCFHCGTCIRCDNCLLFCPDMAISRTADGLGFQVDLQHCKGCGACAAECPRGALVMREELA